VVCHGESFPLSRRRGLRFGATRTASRAALGCGGCTPRGTASRRASQICSRIGRSLVVSSVSSSSSLRIRREVAAQR
jgi:hypothetical protein